MRGFSSRVFNIGETGRVPSGEPLGGVVLPRLHFFGRALPVGANLVAAVAVDALGGDLGLGQGTGLGGGELGFEFAGDAVEDFLLVFLRQKLVLGQVILVARDGVFGFPFLEHPLGDVLGGVVLGVAPAAKTIGDEEIGRAS